MKVGIFIAETLRVSIAAIKQNKLRSILSVLGISIGIYCIIAVYALVHSLEMNINKQFTKYGTNVLFVQKWPWDEFTENYPWWKYLSRPVTSPDEAAFLEDKLPISKASLVAYTFTRNDKVSAKGISLEGANVVCVSHQYLAIQSVSVEYGRLFTQEESKGGQPVVILGHTIASNLFGLGNSVGENLRIGNRVCRVVGVCASEGQSIIDNSKDEQIIVPVKFGLGMYSYRESDDAQVVLEAAPGIELDDLSMEVSQLMRQYRKIKPGKESSFSVNKITMITQVVSELFGQIQNIGIVIGGFAMLVGCFGVANIMFVSVKERTKEIGIQKALGAPHIFIQFQFLLEAVWLSLIGGFIGLVFVWITFQGLNVLLHMTMGDGFELILSAGDTQLGLWVSALVGIVAGFIPATQAARLNPVEAMRAN
ncbi:MAG: ABC transporter [Flavobacteriales bacterium]|nr:MAG: ABC transporter [Flavobacteriales bacterium]